MQARVECFNQKLRDEEYKPVYVDITTKPAHIWIKVGRSTKINRHYILRIFHLSIATT